jgi:hypothetical protein
MLAFQLLGRLGEQLERAALVDFAGQPADVPAVQRPGRSGLHRRLPHVSVWLVGNCEEYRSHVRYEGGIA